MAKHLTREERKLLSQWLGEEVAKSEIAKRLGRDRTTIHRELNRNAIQGAYSPAVAQAKAEQRRRQPRRPCKMDSPELNEYVREGLVKYWSPDQIAGRSRRDFPRNLNRQVSRQTIYNWIACQGALRSHWEAFLRFGPRQPKQETRGKLRATVSIEGRPKVIDERRRYGDWEGDTVVGKRRRSGLLTVVERKSGYLLTGKVGDLKSKTINRVARRKMKDLPSQLRHSLTLDNGKEFADHHGLRKQLALSVYFAEPYRPWQRGTNENTNGLLRQFYPKGTDFAEVSHPDVARTETLINERPRKRLNYRTPQEVLAKKLGVAVGV